MARRMGRSLLTVGSNANTPPARVCANTADAPARKRLGAGFDIARDVVGRELWSWPDYWYRKNPPAARSLDGGSPPAPAV